MVVPLVRLRQARFVWASQPPSSTGAMARWRRQLAVYLRRAAAWLAVRRALPLRRSLPAIGLLVAGALALLQFGPNWWAAGVSCVGVALVERTVSLRNREAPVSATTVLAAATYAVIVGVVCWYLFGPTLGASYAVLGGAMLVRIGSALNAEDRESLVLRHGGDAPASGSELMDEFNCAVGLHDWRPQGGVSAALQTSGSRWRCLRCGEKDAELWL